MKRLLATSSVFLLTLSQLAIAREVQQAERPPGSPLRSLEVSAIGTQSHEAEPRRIVTSLFFIDNGSAEELEVSPRVGLPDGWLVITGDSTIHVGAHQRSISLVSVLVPRTAQPRKYRLTYVVSAAGRPDLIDWCSVPIIVLPVTKLEVKPLSAPDFVVAGDEFRASFAVSNRGNVGVTASLRAQTACGLPFVFDNQMMEMAPGQTRIVELSLKTDSQIKKAIRDNLTLLIEATDPKAEAHATSRVEIIPRITGAEDRFERIPSLLAVRNVTSRNGAARSRFQAQLAGDGAFGEAGVNHLTFLAKGPDIQQIGVLGRRDEYTLAYSTAHCEIAVGDRTYAVSQLSESHRYGRGLEANFKLKRLRLGAYRLVSMSGEPREDQTAAFVDYALSGAASAGLNYLLKHRDGKSQILGLEGRLAPAPGTDLEMEYSASLGDDHTRNAYYLRLRTTRKRASGFLRCIHADRAYPGYFQNMDFVAGVLDVSLRPTSRLDASFRQERHNLSRRGSLSLPTEREYQVRLDERLGTTDASLGWRTRSHDDRHNPAGLDYTENVVRSSVGQRLSRWNYYTALEAGWIHDGREGRSSALRRWSASVNLRPTNRQSYGCYVSYDTSRIPGKTRKRYLAVSLTSSLKLRPNTTLDLGFRSNDYEDGHSFESNMVDVTVSHRLPNKSTLLIRGYYRPWESTSRHDEAAVSLEYAIPVGVPVARRQSVGAVKGRVFDELTGLPVEDAILRLDGATAVTDARGNFTFPSIAKGEYYLRVDRASIGLDHITVQKTPIDVAVEGGEEKSIQIGVTRSASLHGKVVLYKSKAGGTMLSRADTADLVEDHGVGELLVELTDGVETKRVITDEQGRFDFEEMRPGAWTLTVSEANLPEYTRLEKNTLEFHPMPGEEMQVLVRAVPQRRQVQILHEGGVLKEEQPRK